LEPFSRAENLPSWIQNVYQFQIVKAASFAKEKGILGKAAEEGKKLVTTVEKTIGRDVDGANLESQMQAAKAYQEYRSALNAITSASTSRNQAYQMALQVFSEDPVNSKAPFFTANNAVSQMKIHLGKGKPLDEIFWKLVIGPIDFMWTFVRMETACHLQNIWEQTVLAEAQDITGPQTMQILLSPDGLLWKFVKGPGAPFINWNIQRGYAAKEVLGGTIPFAPSFFTFLRQGAAGRQAAAAKPNYKVVISGLPTDANPDALKKPHRTRLEVQCGGAVLTIINENYPVRGTFNWSPESCRDTLFQIEVGDLVLTKKYSGNMSFAEFLQDFRGGERTFYPREFPAEKADLEALGIKSIRVNYQFSGDYQSAIGQIRSLPGQVPRTIVRCWEQ
jgi:type VI secretion system protein ImpL